MKKIIRYIIGALLILLVSLLIFGLYLNRGLPTEIKPATFECLDIKDGYFADFDTLPNHIYGIGLAYAGHINETASEFDPQADPPVFKKATNSIIGDSGQVKIPRHQELLNALEQLEPGISEKVEQHSNPLPALVDYEVELGFVLLENINAVNLENDQFAPKIGFFIANDLSARSLAVLGEGQSNRYDYWGISKSFVGFTPMSNKVWIPNTFKANGLPCIMIETLVNSDLRQQQTTSDLIYTPLQMLQAIHRRYPNTPLLKGDLILTGTPKGVALNVPRWLVRLAGIIGIDRFGKLSSSTSESNIAKFLKNGDIVLVRGKGLGSVGVTIVD